MSAEIWKVGQKPASEVYENFKNGKDVNGENACFALRGDINACNQMAAICDAMREDYQNVIKDENDYLAELEALNEKIDEEELSLEEKINALQHEIDELQKKIDDGTATEEDKEDCVNKQSELNILLVNSKTGINAKTDDFISKNTQRRDSHKNITAIANDYGNTTIEKGTPLAETKVSHGFFKKLFGKTGKNKKKAGEMAVKAGQALLAETKKTTSIEKYINASTRKK